MWKYFAAVSHPIPVTFNLFPTLLLQLLVISPENHSLSPAGPGFLRQIKSFRFGLCFFHSGPVGSVGPVVPTFAQT